MEAIWGNSYIVEVPHKLPSNPTQSAMLQDSIVTLESYKRFLHRVQLALSTAVEFGTIHGDTTFPPGNLAGHQVYTFDLFQ